MITGVVVLAEISACVEDGVNASKLVGEIGYVPNVSKHYTSRGVTKLALRFFL